MLKDVCINPVDSLRVMPEDTLELQDQLNVNTCDGCDDWLDADVPDNGLVTIIDETEFWERYGDF